MAKIAPMEVPVVFKSIPPQQHHVSLVRLYDENDEVDMEIVTSDPSVFSITFSQPRQVHAVSVEPGRVPLDPSLR